MFKINRLGTGDDSKAQFYPDFASFPPATGSSRLAWDEAAQKLYIDDPGTITWKDITATSGGLSTVSDTNTVNLTKSGSDLSADVVYQDSSSIDLSDDASGLKADIRLSATSATAGNLKATTTVEVDGLKTEIPDKLFRTDKITLTAGDITNKYVVLSLAPANKPQTQLIVIGGPGQEYSIDFEVTTDNADRRLSWDSLGLDGILEAGDRLIVNYN